VRPGLQTNARLAEQAGPSATVEFLSPTADYWFPDEWYQMASADHFWLQWRFAAVLRLMREIGLERAAPLRALDIGGGTGVVRGQLEAVTQWTIDITDLHPAALHRALPGRGRNLCYDVTHERAEMLGRYDVVILFDVLEHLEPTRPFLLSVARHLRPGGTLLVNVPALQALFSAYDRAAGHRRRYDRRSLAAEFGGTTLDVRAVAYWGALLLPLLFVRKLVLPREAPPNEIIRTGFEPPGRVAHGVLRALMRLETLLFPRPPVGSSLVLAARRA
jgi:SAM-dependent methyltransferase